MAANPLQSGHPDFVGSIFADLRLRPLESELANNFLGIQRSVSLSANSGRPEFQSLALILNPWNLSGYPTRLEINFLFSAGIQLLLTLGLFFSFDIAVHSRKKLETRRRLNEN